VFSVASKLGRVVEFMLSFPEVELVRRSRVERVARHGFVPCMAGRQLPRRDPFL
jgi:hypothetical protein